MVYHRLDPSEKEATSLHLSFIHQTFLSVNDQLLSSQDLTPRDVSDIVNYYEGDILLHMEDVYHDYERIAKRPDVVTRPSIYIAKLQDIGREAYVLSEQGLRSGDTVFTTPEALADEYRPYLTKLNERTHFNAEVSIRHNPLDTHQVGHAALNGIWLGIHHPFPY